MSKAKMEAARELIREKRYNEARVILQTVDHPLAQEWIAKIDSISPPQKSSAKVSVPLIAGAILVLVLIMGSVVVYTQRERIPAIAALSASATPTPTLGRWHIIGNESQLTAFLPAEDRWDDDSRPQFYISCTDKTTFEAFIAASNWLIGGDGLVSIRLDNNSVRTVKMVKGRLGTALYFPKVADAISTIIEHNSMVLEMPMNQNNRDQELKLTFDLRGLANAIKPVAQACNMPEFE